MSDILVSVCCLAFNHEAYMRQALEGFVMQDTNFAFEVLVHDDASTDKTVEIIREFETNYPNIIKPIYQVENQYSKGISATFTHNFPRAKGKYIAMCEGDDYWTDPLKLQKQVDFLEKHEDFGVIHTDSDVYYQDSKTVVKNINKLNKRNLKQLDNPAEALILGNYAVYTLTTLFRRSLLEKLDLETFRNYKMNDLPMWLTFSRHTKFFYLDESTAVYRKSEGSASNPKDKSTKLNFKVSSKKVRLDFAKSLKLNPDTVAEISDQYHKALLRKQFENIESERAFQIFKSINEKTFKDVLLLFGCKSKVLNTFIKKTKPNMA